MAEPKQVMKWVGIGCGAFVLLAALGVGACVFFIKGATDAPADQSHLFFAKVRGGDVAGAHALMSPEYRASHPPPLFQQSVSQLPVLTMQTDSTFNNRSVNNGVATMSGFLSTPQGSAPVTVMLSHRSDDWLIDSITVAGQPLR